MIAIGLVILSISLAVRTVVAVTALASRHPSW